MEKLSKKIQSLREECEAATLRADTAEASVKVLTESQMDRDQEIVSFQNKVALLEEQLDTAELKLREAKVAADEDELTRSAHDELVRKVQVLEETLETRELELKETREQLRTVDVKAEHLERTVQKMESERDESDARYEELNQKYLATKAEFEATIKALDDM
ncbi:tropomyosin-2 [Dimargaris cristalligena]|uniref:Tropomyosin n=1 Tax=Dimargaris cristalligena TaxID=215637 RepID=A0A4P9ZRG9_9FUNG|nr:tropomyosin-2 [Dimargaris cristalligena]RKP36126.1 tropomyosin [Dimargaris cristalligena]|eukprot:RKP36126.1 tropomyosin [Dimargaris cristalligena]